MKTNLKVSISTLGCKSNQYDSSALEDILRAGMLDVVPFPGPADAYVINTCTVTGKTDSQSRQLIRRVRKINPDAVVIVTGCYAQVASEEVSRIEGVDYVLGNPQKGDIIQYLLKGRQRGGAKTIVGDYREGTPFTLRAKGSGGKTRANLKVQDGCDRSCSYCIIPKARGPGKSLPVENVEREMDTLVENGFREIILTGIHLGAYGTDFKTPLDITSILRLIERKDYPCRFRLSSLDPDEVTGELIEILKDAKRVCNHLHLPLQSGDDTVIRKMRRPYTASEFAKKVLSLAGEVPEISIGADVIAGFPGEGEREFENTFSLLNDLPISYLHIFPYSKRSGTPAADFTGQVDARIIKLRCRRLKELDDAKRDAFYRGFAGKTAEVLVESARDKKTGLLKGRARNYIPVFIKNQGENPAMNLPAAGRGEFKPDETLKGQFAEVLLSDYGLDGMAGAPL